MEDDQLDLMSSLQFPVEVAPTNAEEDDDGLNLSSSLQLRSSLAATVRSAEANVPSISNIVSPSNKMLSPASKLHTWLDAQQSDSHTTATPKNVLPSPPTGRPVKKQVLQDISEFECALKSENGSALSRGPNVRVFTSESKPIREFKPQPQPESVATSTLPVNGSSVSGTPPAHFSSQSRPTTENITPMTNNSIKENNYHLGSGPGPQLTMLAKRWQKIEPLRNAWQDARRVHYAR